MARAAPVAPAAAPQVVEPPAEPSVDEELQAWKEARGSQFKMPWSQLSLMASLCFGIASFVLPDSVNDNVEWLLWALSAIAAYVWWTNRKKKRETKAPDAP
ncbi:MAG TPA: hypothetical protein VMF58_02485 [Rhizomicrobium sp.]|nr:hypothetical protein [Rhizomicrobium sp.]